MLLQAPHVQCNSGPFCRTARDLEQIIHAADFLGARIKNIIGLGEISAYGLPGEAGVLLVRVPADSAADKAGLKEGDVILKCRGQEISSVDDLFKVFGGTAKGARVALDMWRLQQHVFAEVNVE